MAAAGTGPVKLIAPRRFGDARGWFMEVYAEPRFTALGIDGPFVQDNHSMSGAAWTLRGLHFQRAPHAQGKLVRCVRGRIFDVAVDVRRGSPTWGRWVGAELSAENGAQLWVPAGFAHGFLTLEDGCEVAYKVTSPYAPECEGAVAWDDAAVAIDWPLPPGTRPVLSGKDADAPTLAGLASPFEYDGAPLAPLAPLATPGA